MIQLKINRMTSQTEECGASYGNEPYNKKELSLSIDTQDLIQLISFVTFCILQLKYLLALIL